jgi:fructose-bisphosphate aldolase class 1
MATLSSFFFKSLDRMRLESLQSLTRDVSTTCEIALLCNGHVGKWTGSTDTISEKDQPWTFLFKFHRILSSDLKKKEDKVAILNVEQCHWT